MGRRFDDTTIDQGSGRATRRKLRLVESLAVVAVAALFAGLLTSCNNNDQQIAATDDPTSMGDDTGSTAGTADLESTGGGSSTSKGRSSEAFCGTLIAEQERIRSQLDDMSAAAKAQSDGLASVFIALGGIAQATGEVKIYARKLAETAPEEIRVEMDAVNDYFASMKSEMPKSGMDALAGAANALVEGMAISGPLDRVNEFAVEHCGRPF